MFQVIQGLTIARINILVDLRLQPAVWDRVMHLPTQFFQRYGVGDLSLRVLGIKTISTILSGTTVGGVLAGIFSLTSFVVKALYDVQLMIFAAVFAVGSAVLLAVLIRVIPVLEAVPEIDPGREEPGTLSGAISVRNLTYKYHPQGPSVLENISFDVEPGEFVAIVGPSGAGKSTLLRLLLGFDSPEQGVVFYDDQDLARLNLLRVRRQIGTEMQSVGLLPGSLYDNIAGAKLKSREEMMEAARLAGLADDIEAMPMGLETFIGEEGGTLSGGQKQSLMIARVMLRKPQIIFFDEATSALDNRTQAVVTDSLEKFHATRIVIAHRLTTIRRADKILVFDKGKIVQSGTFDVLVNQTGLFKKLAERQIA
jgi:ABC-type bacteriocin/lantibiotic exporter with double-glycine peptidase domain